MGAAQIGIAPGLNVSPRQLFRFFKELIGYFSGNNGICTVSTLYFRPPR